MPAILALMVPPPSWAETMSGPAVVHTMATSVIARPGAFRVEHPTLENLGFEWTLVGDSNHDASVRVEYRETGTKPWKTGFPLLRLNGEEVISRLFPSGFTYVAPNMFSGSIFDLKPDTEYEVRFTLSDPDGVVGEAVVERTVRTRPEPQPAKGGKTYHVYPFGHEGPRQNPAFTGLLEAYYMGGLGGDWYNAAPQRVQPGDIILVHAGTYKDQRFRYGHELKSGWKECCSTTGTGTYFLTAKGSADRPIVIKAAGDGPVIFDGDGNYNLFNVEASDYNYFEGLTFRNTEIAILAGEKNIAGSRGLTVKHSLFEDIGIGIHSDYAGSGDFYIADNIFIGRHNPTYLTGWGGGPWANIAGWKENSAAISQYAVKVYGPGNVVAYNKVRNFHDGIDNATYGNPADYPHTPPDMNPASIDFYNNDISNVHDNCIEADGATQNIRVMRNLCVNSASFALSLQPVLGGPAYFIRNVVYNSPVDGAVKFSEMPAGAYFINNSFFSKFTPTRTHFSSNIHLMNNVIIPQHPGDRQLLMSTFTNYSSSDYNAFGKLEGEKAFEWTSPEDGVMMETLAPLQIREFSSLADYTRATGQDSHSIAARLDAFEAVAPIGPDVVITTVIDPTSVDARPRKGSAVIDRGVIVPNITDGYLGAAPDIGALEHGQKAPSYGPRETGK